MKSSLVVAYVMHTFCKSTPMNNVLIHAKFQCIQRLHSPIKVHTPTLSYEILHKFIDLTVKIKGLGESSWD